MQFNVVANVAMTIVAHPSLFGGTLCFSYIQQQGEFVVDNEVEASTIAPIRFLTK
ncbi:hypothetical protein QUA38_00990 [Microcoleus sp. Pol12B4]